MSSQEASEIIIESANTICILKPDALGDFILALPALWAFRKAHPRKKINLLVSPIVYPLALAFDVADCILPIPLFIGPHASNESIELTGLAIKTLLPAPIDACFILRWDVDYYSATPLAFVLNATYRIGYSIECSVKKTAANPGYDNFLTHAVLDQAAEHEVLKCQKLLAVPLLNSAYPTLHCPSFGQGSPMPQVSYTTRSLSEFIAIGISSSRPNKKLSREAWVQVLDAITSHFHNHLVLFGGPEDYESAQFIAHRNRRSGSVCLNLCGQINLVETIGLLTRAIGTIAVDSFLKHASACVGVPVVEISCQAKAGNPFAEYGGVRFGAWGVATRMVKPDDPLDGCPIDGCLQEASHCINAIDVQEVVRACQEIFPPRTSIPQLLTETL